MKAFVHEHGEFLVKDVVESQAEAGDVVVCMRVAGLNHRDLFTDNKRGTDAGAFVIGSDGAGVLTLSALTGYWQCLPKVSYKKEKQYLSLAQEVESQPTLFLLLKGKEHG